MKNHKVLKELAIGIFLSWVLTLGIYHERSLSARFPSVAYGEFNNGDNPFLIVLTLGTNQHRSIGIPYIFYSTCDVAPFSIGFAVTAKLESDLASLKIDSILVEYDGGAADELVQFKEGFTSDFKLDDRGADRGETSYFRATFSLPYCIKYRESFWVNFTGVASSSSGTNPFKYRLRVDVNDESYWYPGWLALGLSGI